MEDTRKADKDQSASNPGQENRPLLPENPSSNMPPPTDHGDIGLVWYSFDLVHKRVEEGLDARSELEGGYRRHPQDGFCLLVLRER